MSKSLKIVSLFSGAGGLDFGLVAAGHKIVWANDIFSDAVSTYRTNLEDRIVDSDIRQISAKSIPDCDAVVGGFPCQGFSVANWSRTVDDPRNSLYREMLRVVRVKRPAYFVAENVKGLASLGKGVVLQQIIGDFERLGYAVQWAVVSAADYGVPQRRQRLLILGQQHDAPEISCWPPPPTHADPAKARLLGLKPWVSVGKALKRFPEPSEKLGISNHQGSRYKLTFNGYLGHRFVDPKAPAPTVTARGDERGGVVVLHHPGNHRRMTARELAAVQSFPDTFVFVGTNTSVYRQIANAVPPLLGEAIGRSLASAGERRPGRSNDRRSA